MLLQISDSLIHLNAFWGVQAGASSFEKEVRQLMNKWKTIKEDRQKIVEELREADCDIGQ